jgi:hypothetical protein
LDPEYAAAATVRRSIQKGGLSYSRLAAQDQRTAAAEAGPSQQVVDH